MNINLYQFSKRKNSTKQPGGTGTVVSGYLKEGANLRSPSLILKVSDVENFLKYNYMKMLGSFYYLSDKKNLSATEWQIDCVLDDLATYKASINNTDAFVVYSSSEFDVMINDSRGDILPGFDIEDYAYNIEALQAPYSFQSNSYPYVMTVVNGDGITPADTYMLNGTEMGSLTSLMWDDGFQEYFEQKFKGSILEGVCSCRVYPVDVTKFADVATAQQEVKIGKRNTGVNGFRISYNDPISAANKVQKVRCNIDLDDVLTRDFRDVYRTRYMLTIPFCGTFNIDANMVQSHQYIVVEIGMDIVSGDVAATIYATDTLYDGSTSNRVPTDAIILERVGGKCGRDIPVSQNHTNAGAYVGAAVGAVSAAKMAISKANPYVAVASGIASGAAGLAIGGDLNSTITNGGMSGASPSNQTYRNKVVLHIFKQKERFSETEIQPIQGRPCMKVCHLGDLSGYVQTSNASVSAAAAGDIIQSLNASLDAGIYLE